MGKKRFLFFLDEVDHYSRKNFFSLAGKKGNTLSEKYCQSDKRDYKNKPNIKGLRIFLNLKENLNLAMKNVRGSISFFLRAEVTKSYVLIDIAILFFVTQMALTACTGPVNTSSIAESNAPTPIPIVESTTSEIPGFIPGSASNEIATKQNPYPESTQNFDIVTPLRGADAEAAILKLGQKVVDQYKAMKAWYFGHKGANGNKDIANVEAEYFAGANGIHWDLAAKAPDGNYLKFTLTSGSEKGQVVRAMAMASYSVEKPTFETSELTNPVDFPNATEKMIWDSESGWSVIGLFQGTNLVGWFNADAQNGGMWEMLPNAATSTPENSILTGDLSGLATAPDMMVDSAGLHITLTDSSRVVDIAPGDVSKEVVFDSEYNLFKIYDASGNITAEYDPGQGKEGDVDYVPATGWVDVQKLAKDLVCQESGCFYHTTNVPLPNEVTVDFNSTGVFRYVDALDKNTSNVVGKFLLAQMVTKVNDNSNLPVTSWVLVQAEANQEPGANAYKIGVENILYRVNGKAANETEAQLIYSTDKWQVWMPKDSAWSLMFSKSGYIYPFFKFVQGTQVTTQKNISQMANFLTGSGKTDNNDSILVLLSSG